MRGVDGDGCGVGGAVRMPPPTPEPDTEAPASVAGEMRCVRARVCVCAVSVVCCGRSGCAVAGDVPIAAARAVRARGAAAGHVQVHSA
jgi:hypothetical protein